MKLLRGILAVSVITFSTMFAGGLSVSTNMDWTDVEGNSKTSSEYSVMFGLNDNTSVGVDTKYGMLAKFKIAGGANLRLGWNSLAADDGNAENGWTAATIGVGYTFWSSGAEDIKTSLGASVNFGTYEEVLHGGNNPVPTVGFQTDRTSICLELGWSL